MGNMKRMAVSSKQGIEDTNVKTKSISTKRYGNAECGEIQTILKVAVAYSTVENV